MTTAASSMHPRRSMHQIRFSFRMRAILFGIFLLVIVQQAVSHVAQASLVNEQYNNLIPFEGDTHEYQRLAVNLLYGKGFTDSIVLPFEMYHLDAEYSILGRDTLERYKEVGIDNDPQFSFYRAPGLPLLLATTYRILGNDPLVARRLLALLTVLAALILFGMGAYLGGTPGIMAGGITALYLLKQQPGLETAILMTEGPATFWLATFALLISIYIRTHRRRFLFAAGLAFAALCLTRSNFFPTLFFVSTFLLLRRTSLASLIMFALIVIIPVVLWSLMATATAGRLILLTTQGEIAFPQFNNMDVITGTELTRPGTWSPGFSLNERGELYINGKNLAQPGENGWVKGLTFWRDHLDLLPRLFYVKLEANFWYNSGVPMGILRPERVYLSAIGFLLLVIGIRKPSPRRILPAVHSKHVFYGQLALVSLLVIVGNTVPLWIILLIWLFIGTTALLFPYDQAIWLKQIIPAWVLCLVVNHFIVTLLYGEPRFSWPLDPILMLTGLLGLISLLWAPIATHYGYS